MVMLLHAGADCQIDVWTQVIPMRHLLIIESDPTRAERLVDACRRVGVEARYTPDPIHGLIQAMRDAPVMLLIDAEDAWLGDVSVIQEVRRHPTLCFMPVMVLTEGGMYGLENRGIEHGADFVVDLSSRDFVNRIRVCYSKCRGSEIEAKPRKTSVFAKLAASAKSAALSMSSHLPANQPAPARTSVSIGDLMCDGNLFRRIGDQRWLYELRVTRERLWLMPIQRGMTPFGFEDAETMLENFQYLPFA